MPYKGLSQGRDGGLLRRVRARGVAFALLLILLILCWFPQARSFAVVAVSALGKDVVAAVSLIGHWLWVLSGWFVPILLLLIWFQYKRVRANWKTILKSFDVYFGPRHPIRFRRRIRWRVRRLELQLWWSQPKLGVLRRHWPRPLALLLAGVAAILLLRWEFGPEAGGLFVHLSKLLTGDEKLYWHDAAQPLLVLIGLPVAFLLWWFRDIHVSETLENQRKDVNLKQFQEVQIRAAGALDEKLPERARETMQIAAIHQLRPFLKGEFGESFRRPAWELLRARLAASAEVTMSRTIPEWIDRWHAERAAWFGLSKEDREGREPPFFASELRENLSVEIASRFNASRVSDAERAVISDEWWTVFQSALPLAATCFDLIELPPGALLASRDLSRCTFIAAKLAEARFDGANLRRARFDGANLRLARLDGAKLREARLEGADLWAARLDGADLGEARLDGAYLWRARLEGADLSVARLDGAYLRGARLDGALLQEARLDGADLGEARLDGADLRGARLRDAYLRGARLVGADLRQAQMDRADLRRAMLDGADLRGVQLHGADLRGALLDYRTMLQDNWQGLSEGERDTHRQIFRDCGATFREDLASRTA